MTREDDDSPNAATVDGSALVPSPMEWRNLAAACARAFTPLSLDGGADLDQWPT